MVKKASNRYVPKKCRFCLQRMVNASKGLCRRCYDVAEIRCQYAKMKPPGKRVSEVELSPPPAPLGPTFTLPSSSARLAIMRARAAAGLSVFHEFDYQLPLD
jgi:hypothetical protein